MRSRKPEQVTLLPDPPRAHRRFPMISADDHLIEPPEMFEGRVPAKFAEHAPRVVVDEDGGQAVALRRAGEPEHRAGRGRRPPDRGVHLRPGALRRDAARQLGHPRPHPRHGPRRRVRVGELPLGDARASAVIGCSSASAIPSSRSAVVRPSNDWHLEDWAGAYPDRFIPCQIPWLLDPEVAAEEIRRNAARGFKAVSFRRTPSHSACRRSTPATGIRCSAACEETETVVCLHVGSSGATPTTSSDAPGDASACCSSASRCSPRSTGSTRRSRCGSRHQDRARRGRRRLGGGPARPPRPRRQVPGDLRHVGGHRPHAARGDATQLLVLLARGRRGLRRARPHRRRAHSVETDYPHLDGTWPDSQEILWRQLGKLPARRPAEKIAWQNASKLFRHPVPDAVVAADPESF